MEKVPSGHYSKSVYINHTKNKEARMSIDRNMTQHRVSELAERIESAFLRSGPESFRNLPLAYALNDVSITPGYSEIHPNDVDLGTVLGPVTLNVPFLSAPMDMVTGGDMATALAAFGGCGIVYRTQKPKDQLDWIAEALRRRPCLVGNPVELRPDATVSDAQRILEERGFSTIPVVAEDGVFLGLLFTRDVSFSWHEDEPVSKWMKKVGDLKTADIRTPFVDIRDRLRNEQECSVLPVVDDGRLAGLYFMKDVVDADPAMHEGKPLVGMAISDAEEDIAKRVVPALELGIGVVVIDSSHGNCRSVIDQVSRLRKAIGDRRVCVVAGNVADVDGYIRLSLAGADVVKLGIGPGSICTTSEGTGVGFPMFSLITLIAFARRCMRSEGMECGGIIADGGIGTSGDAVKALAAGADAVMAGKMFAASHESISYLTHGMTKDRRVMYRGMASADAIKSRSASGRYGSRKRAPEGVAGYVQSRGRMHEWFPLTLELVRGGFAHTGSRTLSDLQSYFLKKKVSAVILTSAGREQNSPRVAE